MILNSNLKRARKDAGLTQKQVAEIIGITVETYQRYEYAGRIPRADIAIAISDAIGVKSYKLFKTIFGAIVLNNTKKNIHP